METFFWVVGAAGALGIGALLVSWFAGLRRMATDATKGLGQSIDTSQADAAADGERNAARAKAENLREGSNAELAERVRVLRERGRGGK